MRFRVSLALALFSGAAVAGGGPDLDAFRTLFRESLEKYGVIGGSFALVSRQHVIDQENFGYANRELGQKAGADNTYHWGSVTKTFTGIAIMQLRDRGLLKLDDPVVKYVPELRAVHDPFGAIDAVTIRQLMSHSAGFRSPTWPWGPDQPSHAGQAWVPFEPTKWTQVAAMLPYTEILFPPGTRHSYSNLGVVFLGQIIERLSGDDYEVYIDKNIFKPLEMHASYFDRSPYFLLPHRAQGYFLEGGKVTPAPFNFDSGITVSNGGLNSPIADMVKYLSFLAGGPSRKEIYDQVLKRSSLDEMWTRQLPLKSTDPSQGAPSPGTDWVGLSFFLHEDHDHLYAGHGGQQGGFISHIFVDPARQSGYAIAFNTDSTAEAPNTQTLDREIEDYLFAHVFPRLGGEP
jgi:CubicO group peptidase (beta-lactamase class C family)